jgi:hypothetical protein
MITVALPNHACRITWLAMESLCRQITLDDWELIIYEDSDIYQGGKDFYMSYKERLGKAGCLRVKYMYSEERLSLSEKWATMAEMSHPDSIGMILQASDCYSEPLRINTAMAAFEAGMDWVQSQKGVFYNIITKQTMLFQKYTGTALNMAIAMKHARNLNDEERYSGVDSWLYNQLPPDAKIYIDESDNWKNGVDTDGHNRISIERRKYYRNPQPPFYKTEIKIEELLPPAIIDKL